MMNLYDKEPWKEVYDFWFDPENMPYWFEKSDDFDKKLHDKFYETWKRGCEGLLSDWRENIYGRIAEIIVLDQFSRNLCRNEACAFSQDGMALILAQEAIKLPEYKNLKMEEKKFIAMPFMHSESKGIHEEAVKIFEEIGHEESLNYEHLHKDIIDRFGRYPHRNKVLGRASSIEELAFLKEPNSSF